MGRHRLGIWAFLVTVAFIPGLMSAAIVGRLAIIAIGIPVVGKISFRFPAAIQIALAMGMAWAAASLIITPDRLDGSFQFFIAIVLIGVMGIASQVETLDDALTGMCLGVGVSSLFCLSALTGHRLVDQGSSGYAGLFYNSEILTELSAVLLVWAVVSRRPILVVMTVLPLLVNASRISIAAAVVALVYAYWPKSWTGRSLLCLPLIAAAGTVLFITSEGARFGGAAQRAVMWLATAMAITPAGYGIGWYRASHLTEEFAHSDILQALAELGIGALCFAVVPVYALLMNRGDHAERAAFVVVCIELAVSFPLHVPANAFLAALLAGYLVRGRVPVFGGGYHRRGYDGADGQWEGTVSGDHTVRGRLRSLMVSVRCQAEGVSALGSARSRAEGV